MLKRCAKDEVKPDDDAEDEDEEDDALTRIVAYLDEAEELLDETEAVAKEVVKAERDTFHGDLSTAASAVRSAHTKAKAALRKRR